MVTRVVVTQHDETRPLVRFELFPVEGPWRFRFVGGGEVLVLSTVAYSSPDKARRDIERMREPGAACDACMAASGSFYFECKNASGVVIAISRMFELPRERDDARALLARSLLGELNVVTCEP